MIKILRKYRLVALIALFVIWGCLVLGTGLALAQQDESSNAIDLGVTYGEQTGLASDDIRLIIARVIRAALGLLGILVLAIMLYGGYVYMTAAGNEEKVAQGKKILINGVIGLLIILASLAIVQFIFSKLQEATMGKGTPAACSDPVYFENHKLECLPPGPGFCEKDPALCCDAKLSEQGVFFARSITPVSEDARMNNVAARSVFSQPINNKFSAGDVFKIKLGNGADITAQFEFAFILNAQGKHVGVEAVYKTNLVDNGKYSIEINKGLTNELDKKIMEVTDKQCPFPLSAEFNIEHKNKLVLNFDGKDDYAEVVPNPLSNGSLSVEAWIYPTEKRYQAIAGVGPSRFYLRLRDNNQVHFRLADVTSEPGKYKICDILTNPDEIKLNQWSHIAATFDNETKEGVIYVNGKKASVVQTAKHQGCGFLIKGNIRIGALLDSNNLINFFAGDMSSVCAYNSALSPEDAAQHFADGLGSCGEPGKNKIVAGWHFDDARLDKVLDYTGSGKDAILRNGPAWRLSAYEPKPDGGVKIVDKVHPVAGEITLDGQSGVEQVYAGKLYNLGSRITDNSGVGYGNVKIEMETASEGKRFVSDYFTGPAVKRKGGSDALPDNPYDFSYLFGAGSDLKEPAKYDVEMKVFDIDNNFSTQKTSFVVLPASCENGGNGEGCGGLPGDDCVADWQCDSGKCAEGKCVAQPKILSVSPLNGAAGNYVTIVGKYFGTGKGAVQFGYDDKWVDAKVVECGKKMSWYNTWVIVEVPADIDLAQGSKSDIKIERADSTKENQLLDYANDEFGPKIGLFEKNDKKRPGLCSVAVSENQNFGDVVIVVIVKGSVKAPPKTKVEAIGSAFGQSGQIFFGGVLDNKGLMGSGVQAQYASWTDTLINSSVPTNMKDGMAAVYVVSAGEPSNGVPFTIANIADLAKDIPVIDQIDPVLSTPKSWITILGHGFGLKEGVIYLADSAEHAKDCAQEKEGAACVSLNLELPEKCGNTWSDTQVIAAVPENIAIKKYFLLLKNVDGLHTGGDDVFEVKIGAPMPGICKLEPDFGAAPLLFGDYLKLHGVNFSDKISEDNVYFWKNKSVIGDTGTWLKADDEIKSAESALIQTSIPTDDNGLSAQTGPVKVGVKSDGKELLSNSVKYEVIDCRKTDSELAKKLVGQGLQCCSMEGGPEAGQWKSSLLPCAGEPRDAGYVWRFTTGKIHQLPKVVEHCDEVDWNSSDKIISYPSPVPSDLWKKGKEACLNATIAVRFTVPMDKDTLLAKDEKDGKFVNVKVFTCSNGDKPECDKGRVEIDSKSFIMATKTDVLEIRVPPPNLEKNTWYHVELSDKIVSADCKETGLTKCYKDKLQKTKSCGEGTAYCFDFKTGDDLCTLKNAGIAPANYTVHLLGEVLDPAYPFDSKPTHPYYYFVWGRGSQECSVLNVDGMGWQWGPVKSLDAEAAASSIVAPTKFGETPTSTDSRATVTAHKNAPFPEGAEIFASLDEIKITDKDDKISFINQAIKATSILYIDLFPPKVVKWWPNCLEACINSNIGFQFNMPMMTDTFVPENFVLNQCEDETCGKLLPGDIVLTSIPSDDAFTARFSHENLSPGTWYLVKVTKGVKAVGGSDPNMVGKSMKEEFIGKFRTKDDDSPCKISSVGVSPADFLATSVGQKTKYAAVPKSAPDQCSADGQELNPWVYGWQWSSKEPSVAKVTNFKSSLDSTPGCDKNCLLVGSDIGKSAPPISLCGNGKLESGEDCELDGEFLENPGHVVKEIPGKTCSFDCLRPGNLKFSTTTKKWGYCGNGDVEPEAGEECDVMDVKTGKYCKTDCTWTGSSKDKSPDDPNAPVCGSGQATLGEDCDIGISTIGCSNKCLNNGTQLAQIWCDTHLNKALPLLPECKTAISVCGNGKLEQGEECEPKSDTDKTCSDKCLLQNICKADNIAPGLKCNPGDVGCANDCTLLGSSVINGSLCGDGETGPGEYKGCEVEEGAVWPHENPIQAVTAIGNGEVDKISKTQITDIISVAIAYWKGGNVWGDLEEQAKKPGKGAYALKCGNTENPKPIEQGNGIFQYNDCQQKPGEYNTQRGVAKNSCCYERGHRADEYPKNNAMGVCRNTFISVDFSNRFIDEKSLPGNLTVAVGHENTNGFSCYKIGETDVSQEINNVKSSNKIWCAGSITAAPELHYQWSKDMSSVTTTIALYIDALLPENAPVAVFLRGGIDGIKDTNGVGIRNPDLKKTFLTDAWFFETGNVICKIKSVSVKPNSELFDKPLASRGFAAITESANGQKITSIPGQYAWKWDWQPKDNGIFDIPAKGSDSAKDYINIAARSVEGQIAAVANAKITEDIDKNSDAGKIFTGITRLQAMFCENPWPPRDYYPFEEGISFGQTINKSGFKPGGPFDGTAIPQVGEEYFNFKMSYCADNNLPNLEPFLFLKEDTVQGLGYKSCSIDEKECADNADCDSKLYNIPGIGKTSVDFGKGVCWKDGEGAVVKDDKPKVCEKAGDCSGNIIAKKIISPPESPPYNGKYNKIERVVFSNGRVYALTNSLTDPAKDGLAIFDAESEKLLSWNQTSKIKDLFVYNKNLLIIDADKNQLVIYDVSNDYNLTQKGSFNDFPSMTPWLIYAADDIVYIVGQYTPQEENYALIAVSVKDPSNPVFKDNVYAPSGTPVDLQVENGQLFVLDAKNNKIDVFSLSQPKLQMPSGLRFKPEDLPAPLGTFQLTGMGVSGDGIYITAKHGIAGRFYVFKKQNLDNSIYLKAALSKSFTLLGQGEPSDVYVAGDVAYITSGSAGITAMNVSGPDIYGAGNYDPAAPAIISDTAIDGAMAFLGDSALGTLTILDLSPTQSSLSCNKDLTPFKNICNKVQDWAEPFFAKTLSDDTLKRFLFLNDQNDDIVGVQIFKNERRMTAAAWFNQIFGNVAGIKSAKVGGYDAVADGNNYYINALNQASDEKIYNNIYQFSINKNAQQSTKQVFDQLMKSLEFNINISDFGYCLMKDADKQDSIANVKCANDFDCRDFAGLPRTDLSGKCSNDKTRMFRDWERLPLYKKMQNAFSAYFDENKKYPELKSGTYIPGYTVSMWSSWGKFSDITNNSGIKLPTDKINKWVGCLDPKADKQTCWNAASSTFYCPQFASVYEYEFVSTTKKYMFHGPLEYFALGSAVVNDFIIDTKYFTTERGCTPLSVYSPFGAKCGDNVVNIGEECDPPGKTVTSDWGVVSVSKGKCSVSKFPNAVWADACAVNADCGYYAEKSDFIIHSSQPKVCSFLNTEIIGTTKSLIGEKVKVEAQSCFDSSECKQANNYVQIGGSVEFKDQIVQAVGLQDWLDSKGNNIKCVELNTLGYTAPIAIGCQGAGIPSYSNCLDNTQAVKICTDSCKWEFSSCKSTTVCGNGKTEGIESCDDGKLNGTYGHCAGIVSFPDHKEFACQEQHPQFCGNKEIDKDKNNKPLEVCDISTLDNKWSAYALKKENSCSWDCQGPGEYCGDGKVKEGKEECDDGNNKSGDGCSSDCKKEAQERSSSVPPTGSKPEICGNGEKETYNGFTEACDMGAQNGVKCEPPYGKSCSYCSSDCKEVLTVDPINFCGNKKIDSPFEVCEEIDGQAWAPFTIWNSTTDQPKSCLDKGSFSCENQCKELVDNCVACGKKFIAEGATMPKIAIINPMIGEGEAWPNAGSVALFRADLKEFENPYLGHTKLKVGDPTKYHNLFFNNTTFGIESNPLCDGEYGLFFNYPSIYPSLHNNSSAGYSDQKFYNDWPSIEKKDYGDLFQYSVNNETNEIKNDIIMSPAVPEHTFRIVVRWTDKNAVLSGMLYNKNFKFMPPDKKTTVGYADALELGEYGICDEINSDVLSIGSEFIISISCLLINDNVGVHPIIHGGKTHVQAMTVDTENLAENYIDGIQSPYAFFVDAIDESIYKYKDSDIKVEVYEWHTGQLNRWSIYAPTSTFSISTAANTTSNPGAEYWHVFNLEYNKNLKKYEVKPVEKIVTGWCEMQQYIPGEKCDKTQ